MRASNGQFSIAVSDLQLRLPVHDAPGSSPGGRDSRSRTRSRRVGAARAGSLNQNVTHEPRVGRKLGA